MTNIGVNIGGLGVGIGAGGLGAGLPIGGQQECHFQAGIGRDGSGASVSWGADDEQGGCGLLETGGQHAGTYSWGVDGGTDGSGSNQGGAGVGVWNGNGGNVIGEGPDGQAHVPAIATSWNAGIGVSNGRPVGGLGGGSYLSHLPGAPTTDAAEGPPCTIQGGLGRLLFFPPVRSSHSVETGVTTSASVGAGSPTQPTPITAWGQTFLPDYAYISVETLYATLSPSGTFSGSVVGPTYSNAIFPFRSSLISTGCVPTISGSATDFPALGVASEVDYGSLAASDANDNDNMSNSNCFNVAAPQAFAAIVPQWKNGLFWNMDFESPQLLTPQIAFELPPNAAANKPTIVEAGYGYNPTTAPAGIVPSAAGGLIAATTPATGGYAGVSTSDRGNTVSHSIANSITTAAGDATASSTCEESMSSTAVMSAPGGNTGAQEAPSDTQPAPYGGEAHGMRAVKSSTLVGVVLVILAWL